MQILHIDSEKTWRGGENQMRLLVEGLAAQGITCHLAAPPGSEVERRLAPRFPFLPVAMRHELDVGAAYRIARYCKRHSIDLLDCQSSHAHGIGLLSKILFQPQVRLVVHRRVDYQPHAAWPNRLKYQHRAVDQYIAISSKIASILHAYGIGKERVSTVPSAVSSEVYQSLDPQRERAHWRARLGLTDARPLIGQAAAMTNQKGYDTFIRALAHLRQQKIPFHAVVAGDGPLRDSLHALTTKLGLSEQLSFIGWSDEVASLLCSLDVFFMPSNYEGLGTTILEAIFAGCCVVASDVGGIPEIIKHGRSGLLAPPGDDQAFAQLLMEVLASPELRAQLNANARQHIDQHFSLNAMVAGNLAVYRQLLDRRSQPQASLV